MNERFVLYGCRREKGCQDETKIPGVVLTCVLRAIIMKHDEFSWWRQMPDTTTSGFWSLGWFRNFQEISAMSATKNGRCERNREVSVGGYRHRRTTLCGR